jgi:hypothetical protein
VYVLRQGKCSYLQRNWVCHKCGKVMLIAPQT